MFNLFWKKTYGVCKNYREKKGVQVLRTHVIYRINYITTKETSNRGICQGEKFFHNRKGVRLTPGG